MQFFDSHDESLGNINEYDHKNNGNLLEKDLL